MHRKFLMGLAPLLAMAAFVLPTAAQATVPHNFGSGLILPPSAGNFGEEGVEPVIGWGTITLKGLTGGAIGTEIVCHNVIAGDAWNPVGGGPGEGLVQNWAVFDCESNLCAVGTAISVVPENLPWKSVLKELGGLAKTNGFRSSTTGVKVDVTCNGLSTAHFEGSNNPGAPAGTDKGTSAAHPGFIEFDQPGSGTLKEVELKGTSTTEGLVHELGYNEQELAQVK